jgi:hypothetical protein
LLGQLVSGFKQAIPRPIGQFGHCCEKGTPLNEVISCVTNIFYYVEFILHSP